MNGLAFWVSGTPAPQGSKKHVGGGRMVESSKILPAWRKAVHRAAAAAHPDGYTPLDGPLLLTVEFWMPRPVSHPKKTRTYPVGTPDLDKLMRAVGDSLTTSGTICDDSRIIASLALERFVPTDPRHALPHDAATTGAMVKITPFDERLDTRWEQIMALVDGTAHGCDHEHD